MWYLVFGGRVEAHKSAPLLAGPSGSPLHPSSLVWRRAWIQGFEWAGPPPPSLTPQSPHPGSNVRCGSPLWRWCPSPPPPSPPPSETGPLSGSPAQTTCSQCLWEERCDGHDREGTRTEVRFPSNCFYLKSEFAQKKAAMEMPEIQINSRFQAWPRRKSWPIDREKVQRGVMETVGSRFFK